MRNFITPSNSALRACRGGGWIYYGPSTSERRSGSSGSPPRRVFAPRRKDGTIARAYDLYRARRATTEVYPNFRRLDDKFEDDPGAFDGIECRGGSRLLGQLRAERRDKEKRGLK